MSVRQRPEILNAKGQPAWIVDYRDEHGRRKQVKTDALTKKEAQGIEASILTKIEKGKALGITQEAMQPPTFGKFTDEVYLPSMEATVRESTYKSYERLCDRLKDYFGPMTLPSIKADTIEAYFRKAEKETTIQGRAPGKGELLNRRARLGAILEMAYKRDLIQKNYARCVDRPEYTPEEKHVITPGEEKKLLDAAPSWLKPAIVVGLYGGMRESEIAAMTWGNVKDGFIFIPDSKNGESRHVPLNAEIEAALATLDRAIKDGRPVEWVFWNAALESPRSANTIGNAFKRVAIAVKIPATTFHCTRHTFITRMRTGDRTIPDAELMAITGHKTASMIQHYTHVKPEHLRGKTEGLSKKCATPVQHEVAEG